MTVDPSRSSEPLPRTELERLSGLLGEGRSPEVVEQGEALLPAYSNSAELHHLLGVAHAGSGQFEQAVFRFRHALQINPDSAEMLNNLANSLKALGCRDEAIAAYQRALQLKPDQPEIHNNLGHTLYELGRNTEAIASYEKALRHNPDFAAAHYNHALALRDTGRGEQAIASFAHALRLVPDHPMVHNDLGVTLQSLNRADAAIASYERAIQIEPKYVAAHINLGCVLQQVGQIDGAIVSYRNALRIQPDHGLALNNLGLALQEVGAKEEALASFERAAQSHPTYVEAHANLGAALHQLGRSDEAIVRLKRVLEIDPENALAHNNLGCALQEIGCDNEAITSFAQAIHIDANYAEAHNNLGSALHRLGRYAEAIPSFERALQIAPDYAMAHNNLGLALHKVGVRDDAIASIERALQLEPGFAAARAQLLHQKAQLCDWGSRHLEQSVIPDLGVFGETVFPFEMLSLEDNPERHKIRAKRFCAQKYKQSGLPAISRQASTPDRLRIGYFSADFYEHPVTYLMARLFELHNRDRVSLHAFSFGPDRRDRMRARVESAFERFHDVRGMNDRAIARLARSEGIDVAVDLMGHTSDMRAGIFMHQAAPVQIAYLGYPSTSGMPFIDYLIADHTVIPESHRKYYSEKIIYLPGCFMAGDDTRVIADRAMSRAEMGLPERGFVFCCFNSTYKITPAEFGIWMRLLKEVDGSVLWLARTNRWAASNLQNEARKRGVDPSRLVFTERLSMEDHLARHRLADLFLDTFAYNAHATASDALWAGLPVLTMAGEGFAARVGASMLNTLGLPELVTTSAEEYEQLALELATSQERLDRIKTELAERRLSAPLFDSHRFTRQIEHGYELAFQRYLAGQLPDTIDVSERASG